MAGLLGAQAAAIGGLLGGVKPQNANPKLWQYLDNIFLGGTIQGTQKDARDQASAAQAQQQLQGLLAGLPEAERTVALLNPQEWSKQRATAYQTRLTDDGGIYGTQTAGGWQQTGARGPSIAETETAANNLRDYNAKLTPEGFLPTIGQDGMISGANLMPQYGQFAKEKASAGATRVNVPITLPAQNAFAEQMAKNYADRLDAAQTAGDTARDSLRVLSEAQKALQGGTITGAMAPARLAANRGLALLGDRGAIKKVENTETFRSVMGGQVLAVAKQLGSGAGITDADRKFAQEVSGGSIELNENTIKRLIDIQQRQARNTIGKAQRMGSEAFGAVPPAQGLPQSAFGGGARGGAAQNDPLGLR